MPSQTNGSVNYQLIEGSVKDLNIPNLSSTITAGNISGVFSGLWIFGIVMCAVAAMVMYAYAGIRYETVDSGNKEAEIKSDLKRATIGIIGVFGLWLLLNTINPELLRGEIRLPIQTPSVSTVNTNSPVNPTTPLVNRTITGARSDENIRTRLTGAKIRTNKGACTEEQRAQASGIPSCTDIQGLPDEIINVVLGLRNNCPSCSIVISGGTEPGHRTHGKCNYTTGVCAPAVDVQLEEGSDLWKLITNPTNTKLGAFGVCTQRYVYLSATFCDEPTGPRHWHVSR